MKKQKDILSIQEVDSIIFPDDEGSSTLNIGSAQSSLIFSSMMPSSLVQAMRKRKFRLLREAKERVQSVLLDMDTWNVLWQIDGRRNVEEVAVNLTMPLDEVIYHMESLRLMGIICAVDAVYLPDFILEKTAKNQVNKNRRQSDEEGSKD